MLETTIAGSLPKPAWLAEPRMLWAPWQLEGEALVEAKRDATLLVLKEQEDGGMDIVTDGEQAKIGVDVIQFDEPAFNVYMKEVTEWGIAALHRAAEGLLCKTAVHICYGYGIKANIDWKASLGAEWRQYEAIFPALATSRIDQDSVECAGAKVPLDLLGLLNRKEGFLGALHVSSQRVRRP